MHPSIKPPFCAHPHSGACVISIQLEGYDIQPWDNLHGDEAQTLKAGGAYMLQSGLGCVHDEPNVSYIMPGPCRKVNPLTGTSSNNGTARRFFQVWTNPGIYEESLPIPKSRVCEPEMVPIVTDGSVRVRILVGQYLGVDGALTVDTWESTTILHVTIPAGERGSIAIPANYNAHLFVEHGTARFVGRKAPLRKEDGKSRDNAGKDKATRDLSSSSPSSYSTCSVDMAHSDFKLLLCEPHTAASSITTCPRLSVYNIGNEAAKATEYDQIGSSSQKEDTEGEKPAHDSGKHFFTLFVSVVYVFVCVC